MKILLIIIILLIIFVLFYKIKNTGYKNTGYKNNQIIQAKNIVKPYDFHIFTAEWCGHCKVLEESGELDKLITLIKHENLPVNVKFHTNKDNQVVRDYKIRGFPSFIFERKDGSRSELLVNRTAEAWTNKIKELIN